MAETIQTAIFKLREKIDEKDDNGSLKSRVVDLDYLQKSFYSNGYRLQKLKADFSIKYEFRLFYKRWATTVQWKEFLDAIVEPGEDILKNETSFNEGYILLIKNKKAKSDIYSITGGFGHMQLQDFCDYQFGLDIISRLIKTNDKVLRAAKERNFVGGVLGSVKFFRGEYNLNENESFGSFYQELKATLSNAVLKDTFKFNDEELKSGNLCEAKSSFALKKSIRLEKAVELVDVLEKLSKQKPTVDLNLIRKLDKSDTTLIESLNEQVLKFLFEEYQGKSTGINFEICHKDFDKFYDCEKYQLSFRINKKQQILMVEDLPNFDSFCENLPDHEKISSKEDFEKFLRTVAISSVDGDGKEVTFGMLEDHLCAEMVFHAQSYFLVNSEWYVIKANFIKQLNDQTQDFVNLNEISGLLNVWKPVDSENKFNASHLSNKNTLVFDKVCPENIEVCDILKWDADCVYFIHVKKGFDNEMRNLCRQVQIAARRVSEDLRTDKSFLRSQYNTLKSMTAKTAYFKAAQMQLTSISPDSYISTFDGKKPVFVLAMLDKSRRKRSLTNIRDFESNIAKFCLNELVKDMRTLGMDFKILQIKKPSK